MITKLVCMLFSILVAPPVILIAQELPPIQVAGGYTILTRQNAVLVTAISDEEGIGSRSGWFAEIIGNVRPYVGIVGQVSRTYTVGTLRSRGWRGAGAAYTFLGGPRFSARCCGRVVPFAQALGGGIWSRTNVTSGPIQIATFSDAYSAWAIGGGADIRVGAVGFHVASDFMRTDRSAQAIEPWTWRFNAGFVVPMR
jgi:hypothetical protein